MNKLREQRGSSYFYVLIMIMILATFATGFAYMAKYSIHNTVNNRVLLQEQNLLKSIHQAICREASEGKLEILNQILAQVNTYMEDYNSGIQKMNFSPSKTYYATAEKKGDKALVLSDDSIASIEVKINCKVDFELAGDRIKVTEPSTIITTILSYKPVGEENFRTPIQMSGQLQVLEGQIEEVAPPTNITSGDVVFGLLGGFVSNGKTEYRKEMSVNWGDNIREHHLYSYNQLTAGGLQVNGDLFLRAENGSVTLNQSKEIQNVYATSGDVRVYGGVMKGDLYSENGDIYVDYMDEFKNIYAQNGNIILNPANNGKIVNGNIYSNGSISVGNSNQQFLGGIYAQNDITFASLSAKELISGGKITVPFNNHHEFKKVEAKKDIVINGATLLGNVTSEGNITLQQCEVQGDIISNGTVTLNQVHVKGNVYADEIINRYNVTIEGDILKPSDLPSGKVPEIIAPTIDSTITGKFRPEDYGLRSFTDFRLVTMNDISIDHSGILTLTTNENAMILLEPTDLNEIRHIKVEEGNEPIICLNLDQLEGKENQKALVINNLKASNCQLILYSEKDVTINVIGEIDAHIYLPYGKINILDNQTDDSVTVNGMLFANIIESNNKTLYAFGNKNKAYQYLFNENTQYDAYNNQKPMTGISKKEYVFQQFPNNTLWKIIKYYEKE